MYKNNFCIDTSHWEGTYLLDDLFPFPMMVIVKATEYTGYVDPTFFTMWKRIKEKGIPRGAYHFIRPGGVRKQAEHFVNTVLKADPELQRGENGVRDTLWLDLEVVGIGGTEVKDWLLIVEEKTGIRPGIYTRKDIWRSIFSSTPLWAMEYDFWIAWYPTYPDKFEFPPDSVLIPSIPRERHVIWQYGQGPVVGIANACDFNTITSPKFAERVGCRKVDVAETVQYHGTVGKYGARIRTFYSAGAMLITELKSGEKIEGSKLVNDENGNVWIRLVRPVVGYCAVQYEGKEIIKIEKNRDEKETEKNETEEKAEKRIKRVVIEYDDGSTVTIP